MPVRVTQREVKEKEIIGGTAGRVTVDSEPFAGIRPAIIGLRDTMIGSRPSMAAMEASPSLRPVRFDDGPMGGHMSRT